MVLQSVLSSLATAVTGFKKHRCQVKTLNTADLPVVCMAAPLERKLKNSIRFRRRQRVASGVGMIGLGAYLAFADTK